MTKIDLENLPYPMFVTSGQEKHELTRVLACLKDDFSPWSLCSFVREKSLLSKIRHSLGNYLYLSSYLLKDITLTEENHKYLREVWIKKLLAYSPETD